MSCIKPATVKAYISAIRSHYIDANYNTFIFNNPIIKRILDSVIFINPSTTAKRLPITKDILT